MAGLLQGQNTSLLHLFIKYDIKYFMEQGTRGLKQHTI
jgi:hypothetical protein